MTICASCSHVRAPLRYPFAVSAVHDRMGDTIRSHRALSPRASCMAGRRAHQLVRPPPALHARGQVFGRGRYLAQSQQRPEDVLDRHCAVQVSISSTSRRRDYSSSLFFSFLRRVFVILRSLRPVVPTTSCSLVRLSSASATVHPICPSLAPRG